LRHVQVIDHLEAADAGTGNEDVHRAQTLRQHSDGRTHLLPLADVGDGQGRPYTVRIKFGAEPFQAGLFSID
jgi:hypothetical protein